MSFFTARPSQLGSNLFKLHVVLDDGAIMPTRAHKTDAGLDLYSREDKVVPAGGSANFDTGVRVQLPTFNVSDGMFVQTLVTAGFLKSKSGLNVKHNITSDGVIDVGYTGTITVKLYNHGDKDYEVKRGDKISQLCIVPVLTPDPVLVDSLPETDRGVGGFGSTRR